MPKRQDVQPTVITREAVKGIVVQWLMDKRNRQFVAKNVKKDGSARKWRINPKAGRDKINGRGNTAPTNPNHVKVYDMGTAQGQALGLGIFCKPADDVNAWRTLDCSTVTYLRRGAEVYEVQ